MTLLIFLFQMLLKIQVFMSGMIVAMEEYRMQARAFLMKIHHESGSCTYKHFSAPINLDYRDIVNCFTGDKLNLIIWQIS